MLIWFRHWPNRALSCSGCSKSSTHTRRSASGADNNCSVRPNDDDDGACDRRAVLAAFRATQTSSVLALRLRGDGGAFVLWSFLSPFTPALWGVVGGFLGLTALLYLGENPPLFVLVLVLVLILALVTPVALRTRAATAMRCRPAVMLDRSARGTRRRAVIRMHSRRKRDRHLLFARVVEGRNRCVFVVSSRTSRDPSLCPLKKNIVVSRLRAPRERRRVRARRAAEELARRGRLARRGPVHGRRRLRVRDRARQARSVRVEVGTMLALI